MESNEGRYDLAVRPGVWTVSGSLLLASAVVESAVRSTALGGFTVLIGPFLIAASLVWLAACLPAGALTVAESRVFKVATGGLGGWILVRGILLMGDTSQFQEVSFANVITIVDPLVFSVLGALAVAYFARSELAPLKIRWVPAYLLAALGIAWTLYAVIGIFSRDSVIVFFISTLFGVVAFAALIGLGVLMSILATVAFLQQSNPDRHLLSH